MKRNKNSNNKKMAIKKKEKIQLYRCTIPRSMAIERGNIWNDHDINEEIERFRENYKRWSEAHPDRVKTVVAGKGKRRALTADDYIKKFLRHVNTVINTSKLLNWPWEWCIDDLTDDGKFFNPNWIIMGDSQIFSLTTGFPHKCTRGRKKSKKNKRFTIVNEYYSKSPIPVSQFVCKYFVKKPFFPEDETIVTGHIFPYDESLPRTKNDNMLNLYWQSERDNKTTQVIFDHGHIQKVLDRERERFPGIDIQMDNTIISMIEKGMSDPRVDMGIRFTRDYEKKGGIIDTIQILQDRGIKPVDRNGKPIIQEEKPLPEVTKTKIERRGAFRRILYCGE